MRRSNQVVLISFKDIYGMYGDEDRLGEVPYYDHCSNSNTLFSGLCFRGGSLLHRSNIDFRGDFLGR